MSSISARRSSSRFARYSGDSLVKLVCRNVPSTVVCTKGRCFSPAARRRNRRAFPGPARVLYQVKTPTISVDEFSEVLINAQVQPTRNDRPGKLGIPTGARCRLWADYAPSEVGTNAARDETALATE